MFWTILGIIVPAGLCMYFMAVMIRNIGKLFNK